MHTVVDRSIEDFRVIREGVISGHRSRWRRTFPARAAITDLRRYANHEGRDVVGGDEFLFFFCERRMKVSE